MRAFIFSFALIFILSCQERNNPIADHSASLDSVSNSTELDTSGTAGPVLLLHGGAGNISRDRVSDSVVAIYEKLLDSFSTYGYTLLEEGKSAIEVVEIVINLMENDPHFNAGRGAVLNANGFPELDASIMNGHDLSAGAVAGVRNIKNPITLARLVKDSTQHVLLAGDGALKFARIHGIDSADLDYFLTPKRKKQREKLLRGKKYGTVGVVALDRNGNLAAGTSTGGLNAKKFGRVGDSPIIGAGTYADNLTCAVSCTGHGEYFIRYAVAYNMSARMKYLNEGVKEAAHHILHEELAEVGGKGGLIALDAKGNWIMDFNTNGMFRAAVGSGFKEIFIFDSGKSKN